MVVWLSVWLYVCLSVHLSAACLVLSFFWLMTCRKYRKTVNFLWLSVAWMHMYTPDPIDDFSSDFSNEMRENDINSNLKCRHVHLDPRSFNLKSFTPIIKANIISMSTPTSVAPIRENCIHRFSLFRRCFLVFNTVYCRWLFVPSSSVYNLGKTFALSLWRTFSSVCMNLS